MEKISDINRRLRERMTPNTKTLWKGEFNWYGQCFTFHTQTYERDHTTAFYFFCYQLSVKVERSYINVRNYFSEEVDRYKITRVNRKKEVIRDGKTASQ